MFRELKALRAGPSDARPRLEKAFRKIAETHGVDVDAVEAAMVRGAGLREWAASLAWEIGEAAQGKLDQEEFERRLRMQIPALGPELTSYLVSYGTHSYMM